MNDNQQSLTLGLTCHLALGYLPSTRYSIERI